VAECDVCQTGRLVQLRTSASNAGQFEEHGRMGCGISHADVFAPVPIEQARQSSLDECGDRTEAEFREQLGRDFMHKFAQSKNSILHALQQRKEQRKGCVQQQHNVDSDSNTPDDSDPTAWPPTKGPQRLCPA